MEHVFARRRRSTGSTGPYSSAGAAGSDEGGAAKRWKADGAVKSTKPTLWDVAADFGKKKKAAPKLVPEEGAA